VFDPTPENWLRALFLYGKNQSSYKIGLTDRLLYWADKNISEVRLDDFGDNWLNTYIERTKDGEQQSRRRIVNGREIGITYTESQIELLKQDKISRESAIKTIIQQSLNNMVFQKYHTLFNRRIPIRFFDISEDKTKLILNKNILGLTVDDKIKNNLIKMNLGRWDLLGYGFSKRDSDESLVIDHNAIMTNHGRNAFIETKKKRKNLTPLVPILNGYQQGKCFYCDNELFDIHVDHVIPHKAIQHDEIWNLVLTHESCNENKSDYRPPKHFVQKLIDRNESVLKSDLPLKEELKKVLGITPQARNQKVWMTYSLVKDYAIWGGSEEFNLEGDKFYRELLEYLNTSFWERKIGGR
jgi:5-methylcytosine-specific restriction endonuclease McrA